ncbi:MAG: hypothetical protein CL532_00760 [Aestuariivita sp.]|nr:hypothetical protein [Aestuariivita sp.]
MKIFRKNEILGLIREEIARKLGRAFLSVKIAEQLVEQVDLDQPLLIMEDGDGFDEASKGTKRALSIDVPSSVGTRVGTGLGQSGSASGSAKRGTGKTKLEYTGGQKAAEGQSIDGVRSRAEEQAKLERQRQEDEKKEQSKTDPPVPKPEVEETPPKADLPAEPQPKPPKPVVAATGKNPEKPKDDKRAVTPGESPEDPADQGKKPKKTDANVSGVKTEKTLEVGGKQLKAGSVLQTQPGDLPTRVTRRDADGEEIEKPEEVQKLSVSTADGEDKQLFEYFTSTMDKAIRSKFGFEDSWTWRKIKTVNPTGEREISEKEKIGTFGELRDMLLGVGTAGPQANMRDTNYLFTADGTLMNVHNDWSGAVEKLEFILNGLKSKLLLMVSRDDADNKVTIEQYVNNKLDAHWPSLSNNKEHILSVINGVNVVASNNKNIVFKDTVASGPQKKGN